MTNINSYKTTSKTSKQKSQTAVKNHLHVTRRATHEAPKYGYPYHRRGIKTHRRRCHRDHHPRRRSGYCWHHRWPMLANRSEKHLNKNSTISVLSRLTQALRSLRSRWAGTEANDALRSTGIKVAMEAGTDRSENGSGDRPKQVPLRRCAQPASRSRWKRDRSTGIEVAMDRPNRVPLRCCAQPASRLRWKRGSERMMRCDDGRRSLLRRCQSQRFSNLNLSFFHFIPHFYLQLRTKQFAYQEAEAKNPEMMTPSKKRNWENSRAEWVNNINNDPWLTVLGGKKPCKKN